MVDYFELNNNMFSTIPTQLGNLENVEYKFNLDNNNIDGTVPTELGKLTEISYKFALEG